MELHLRLWLVSRLPWHAGHREQLQRVSARPWFCAFTPIRCVQICYPSHPNYASTIRRNQQGVSLANSHRRGTAHYRVLEQRLALIVSAPSAESLESVLVPDILDTYRT